MTLLSRFNNKKTVLMILCCLSFTLTLNKIQSLRTLDSTIQHLVTQTQTTSLRYQNLITSSTTPLPLINAIKSLPYTQNISQHPAKSPTHFLFKLTPFKDAIPHCMKLLHHYNGRVQELHINTIHNTIEFIFPSFT